MSNPNGRFGIHGGQYIPETLMNAVIELEAAYKEAKADPAFQAELTALFNDYAGRPSRLYFAKRMTEDLGGAKIYLKREDLNHTGAHKINNVLGQALLAKRMGKTRLIAETGAGQHGVATATAAALMGMQCVVYMGVEDTVRQALNVYRMRLLGTEVIPVETGTGTLKDAVSAAMREWTNRISDTHYCLGSVMGPHPFPTIVRDFQSVISQEIRQQLIEKEGRLPDAVLACVGGGSNAIGAFYHFIEDHSVRLIGCEAAGRGVDTFETAATIATGKLGIFHGMKSYFCQDEYGQIAPVYSISAGLDYPGIGPEHAWLHDTGRAEYVPITDDEAVNAFEYLSRLEGITVVNARLGELFSVVREELDSAGMLHRLTGGVVLTGGGARMQNISSLARSVFGGAVRIGSLIPNIEGMEKEEFPAQYATIAGALLLEQRNSDEQSIFDPLKSILKKFFPGK